MHIHIHIHNNIRRFPKLGDPPRSSIFVDEIFHFRNHPWFFVAQESGFTHHLPGNNCGKFGKYMGNPPFVESKETFYYG